MLTRFIKITFLLVQIFAASGISVLAQRPCDTLLCRDGRRIPAQILQTKEGHIYYYNCEDFVKAEFTIERAEVISFLPEQKKEKVIALKDDPLPSKNTVTLLAGMNLSDILGSDYYSVEEPSPFQYGIQFQAKRSPLQLLLTFRPYKYDWDQVTAFNASGLNGEFTFTIKKISIGRFTGRQSKGYWGGEFQFGKRKYSYKETFGFPNPLLQTEARTWSLLARFGRQHVEGPFFWDLAFSIGYRNLQREGDLVFIPDFEMQHILSFQPMLNAGIRF
ncbi:MAG TPA: hypothetical protein DCF33_11600 [Saprospirales bacterium]|nr:hypothetical protein [Saprospirales bacterium]